MPSQATPSFNRIYRDEWIDFYIVVFPSEEMTLHVVLRHPITPTYIKHIEKVFMTMVALLEDRGMDHIDTWLQKDDIGQHKFAEHFGFEMTGQDKLVQMADGLVHRFTEMRFVFPKQEGHTD